VDAELVGLSESNKEHKKKIAALEKDKCVLQARLAQTDLLLTSIGGQLTEAEAKTLILKKLYDLAKKELSLYMNAEKRRLIHAVETLWNKYAVSRLSLENKRTETLKELDGFLQGLRYVG
jgi:type I restriction enzyme M protein